MNKRFAGRVALVTGAASGIGRAAAIQFASEGARVVAADLDSNAAKETVEIIATAGGEAIAVETDVTNEASVAAMTAAAVDRYGRIDAAFNNAGISGAQHARFMDDPLQDFDKVIGINLFGALVGTQCAARHMKDHGGGVILNNASIAGVLPGQALITYRASKAALISLAETASVELAPSGIRVYCIAPGRCATELRRKLAPEEDQSQIMQPDEVARVVMQLLDDTAGVLAGHLIEVKRR